MTTAHPQKSFFKTLFSQRLFLTLAFGFSSGLPLLLISGTLKIWMTRENIDIKQIGYFSWVGLAYSLKFLWAPLVDRFVLFGSGRRRSWIFVTQLGLVLGLLALSSLNPQISLAAMAAICVIIAFLSATQDMAIDAYRRETLEDVELGLGSSLYQYGYRIAMLVTGGLGIGLVGSTWGEHIFGSMLSWGDMYKGMALLMALCMIITYFAPEPSLDKQSLPKTLRESVIEPFHDFFTRHGAWTLLCFVFLFKLGDALSGSMLSTFYVKMGYSNEDIALIAKTFGLASTLVGLFLGGVILYYIGTYPALWIFGILQALSTASFALVTFTGPVKWALASVVIFEDVSSGMGSAAFVAFIATITNKKYTGTQFALLSSLATLGRNFFSGFSGIMVEALSWDWFFYICALIAIPGLLMLFWMRKYQRQ